LFSSIADLAHSSLYSLSLHDALPIFTVIGASTFTIPAAGSGPYAGYIAIDRPSTVSGLVYRTSDPKGYVCTLVTELPGDQQSYRSEEHTSELQSLRHLVCRLLLEKKK